MSQPRARIASQLGIALAVILAVVISGSTVFALRSLDSANLQTREEHLASEARLLADQLNTFHSTLRESTQRLSGLFEKRFGAGLSVHAEQTVNVAGVATPSLYLGDAVLNNNFDEVDEFKQMSGGVATVFVRSGEDFIAARGAPPAPNSCVIAMIIVMIGKAIDNPPKAAELSGR